MKIDMHCHSYYSKDGISSPESIINQTIKKGLDGIAITDHNTTKCWNELISLAKQKNIILVLGEEIKVKENNKTIGEILAYFIQKEIDPKGKTIPEIIKEIKDQGGIAIMSHPYHRKKPFKEIEKYKNQLDGIEIFNSRSQTKEGNDLSFEIVQKNSLPFTAGSDAHTPWEIGRAYIETDAKNIDELKNNILNRKITFKGKQTPLLIQILSPISKLIHLISA